MNKGIVTSKQERERIPIKMMFGNDEDTVQKYNNTQKLKIEEDQAESVEVGSPCLIIALPRNIGTSHQIRKDRFLEDEKNKQKDTNPVMKTTQDRSHQPIIKVNNQKLGRQNLNTAGPKLNFQTSLSPDFLNLFAH